MKVSTGINTKASVLHSFACTTKDSRFVDWWKLIIPAPTFSKPCKDNGVSTHVRGEKERNKKTNRTRHLTRNLPIIENGSDRDIELIAGRGMNINGVESIAVASEELLPQWKQWQQALRQEHEGNLGFPLERIVLHRHYWRPPEQLFVAHNVHQSTEWPGQTLEALGVLTRSATIFHKGVRLVKEIIMGDVLHQVRAPHQSEDNASHENDKKRHHLDYPERRPFFAVWCIVVHHCNLQLLFVVIQRCFLCYCLHPELNSNGRQFLDNSSLLDENQSILTQISKKRTIKATDNLLLFGPCHPNLNEWRDFDLPCHGHTILTTNQSDANNSDRN